MHKKHRKLHEYLLIPAFIVFISILILSVFVDRDMWWDASVYIGMGKYIYSHGQFGLWEPSRPLIWPLILGLFWKLGLDPILFGKITVIIFSIGCSVAVYLIALRFFGKENAFYSTLFFSFSSTFLLFSSVLYSDIPSTCFLLFGIFFFFENKHALAGILLGISFMARFYHLFFIIPIIITYAYKLHTKKIKHADFLKFISLFFIPAIFFLMANLFLYNDSIYPFKLQIYMTKFTGWIFHEPFSFYFVQILRENYLSILSILGVYFIAKTGSKEQKNLLMIAAFPFMLYNLEIHKEMRFMIAILPFIYMAASEGILKTVSNLKIKNALLPMLLILFIFQSAGFYFDRYDDKLDVFYSYMESNQITEGIWISNPSFILHSDVKADELIYYPLYNSGKAAALLDKIGSANLVMINTCDIMPCPKDDLCDDPTQNLIMKLGNEMKAEYNKKHGDCGYYIFQRAIS